MCNGHEGTILSAARLEKIDNGDLDTWLRGFNAWFLVLLLV